MQIVMEYIQAVPEKKQEQLSIASSFDGSHNLLPVFPYSTTRS